MIRECTITLNLGNPQLYSFLEYINSAGFPPLRALSAIVWPFSSIENWPVMQIKFALEDSIYDEDSHKALVSGGFGYYNDEPCWNPADIVNLRRGYTTFPFLADREQRGFDVRSTMSSYLKSEWRFAFGFFDQADRDVAMHVLTPFQDAEREKMLNENPEQHERTNKRFQLSSREGYDVMANPGSLSHILSKIDWIEIPPTRNQRLNVDHGSFIWVYHAGITAWGDTARQLRIFTHVSLPSGDDTSRHPEGDMISRWFLDKCKIEFTPHYLVRMMLRRDEKTIQTLCQAIEALSDKGIQLGSLQTTVPPSMEREGSYTLYSVPSIQEQMLSEQPY